MHYENDGNHYHVKRVSDSNRHLCCSCHKKRDQKFMHKTGRVTNYGIEQWKCNFCPKDIRSKNVQYDHTGQEVNHGRRK